MKNIKTIIFSLLLALGNMSIAFAHESASLPFGSFILGFTHPVIGIDHFLAIVSVSFLSIQSRSRAIWILPSTFLVFMAAGGLLNQIQIEIESIKMGIAISVIGLGLLIASDRKIPMQFSILVVAFFAFFHGSAYSIEMPSMANTMIYIAGFLTGTIAIYLLGIMLGDIAIKYSVGYKILRNSGILIVSTGLFYFFFQ
ncbi:MAG: HupE/UreJ family protein [Pseudomonadota bacterium]|nr:HupE/UreJ family protein [Pseudomonadota bacterium]